MAVRSRPLGTRGVPRAVRERDMIEIGRRLFAESGYNAVSVDEIARQADVTKPMVYAYFGSKEGLYLACVEDVARELIERLEEATPATLPPDVRVWRGVRAVLDFVEASPRDWGLFHAQAPVSSGPLGEAQRRATERIARRVADLIYEAGVEGGIDPQVARESIDPIAHAFVAAMRGLAVWWQRHPDQPKDLVALQFMNFAWKGFEGLLRSDLWLPPAK
jgi:AcrR family transcriptional regulator